MLRCITLYLCLIVSLVKAQFADDFADLNFTSNPTWMGDTIDYESSSGELHLSALAKTDTSFLYTNSSVSIAAEWILEVTLNFNPSSSNNCRIYLMSSEKELKGSTEGYFVLVGGSSDEISLYRQDQFKISKIIDGINKKTDLGQGTYRVKVSRDSSFLWTLYSDTSKNQHFQLEGSIVDSTYKYSNYFGIYCKYTSTRSDKFFFDDIEVKGKIYKDMNRPKIIDQHILSEKIWQLRFNEAIQSQNLLLTNFKINSTQNVETFDYDSANSYLNLHFDKAFKHGQLLHLKIDGLADLSGNYINSTTISSVFNHLDSVRFKHLIFNEIMADPEPSIQLPEVEYLEIYNRSNDYIKMSHLYLLDSKDSTFFPSIIIKPKEYLLLVDVNDSSKWDVSDSMLFFLPTLSLNNTGESLVLKTVKNKTIDSVFYSPAFHEETKGQGGWSLELINPNFLCSGQENWTSSKNPNGGSPFIENSVNSIISTADSLAIEKIIELGSHSLSIRMNTSFQESKVSSKSVSILPYLEVISLTTKEKDIHISFHDEFEENRLYTISIDSITNCYDQFIHGASIELPIPSEVSKSDVVINEVLFNSHSGEKKFIELLNNSTKYIDLSKLTIGTIENGIINDSNKVIDRLLILNPNEYVALTEDSLSILNTYKCSSGAFIFNTTIPSLNDKYGHISLYSSNGTLIDEVVYNEAMHFSGLDDLNGISLERISPNSESKNISNWTSAASSCHYATPGLKNSQYMSVALSEMKVEPGIFSPDNDGYNDLCKISISSESKSSLASINIYNENGYLIRQLVDATLIGKNESFFWDGTDKFTEKVPIGYYMITVKLIHENGTDTYYKSTVVVANRK